MSVYLFVPSVLGLLMDVYIQAYIRGFTFNVQRVSGSDIWKVPFHLNG